ncbi:tRNA threonylcarbamoyl adenosine modification protein YeaZ [Bifidobacterium bohemicum]|uniref:Glycoprotease protein family n=1 Tax=Bifidobacterium bohemicum DSM 22767 TaxID=1437606 RepID=A0A086ZJ89_9BIFI|nr:tRNA (adenosine(37)-N6)-threonylcarbamoyltransferase complex dimerization subunit type 1 TsaB [Bifidobacterium bohemicum]KFI46589.1 glycoprotease protein family [Bifidobacterium bohemicum DSM 22767]SCB76016.1 tRNA threonylcarbamoyl adenosine modification protein YeaZ [Bifidobacterium bohemicum]
MTNTLVIDTSYGSTVGIVGHEPVYEPDSRTHVERLQVNIERACRQARLIPSDLDRIVVGVGPAPFTGLRVGIVTAKAMAFATGAQLIGQDVLAPQAYALRLSRHGNEVSVDGHDARNAGSRLKTDTTNERNVSEDQTRHVSLAVNDARRKQLYFELFDGEDRSKPLIDMDIDYPDHIAKRVLEATERRFGKDCTGVVIDVMGHGAGKYADSWEAFGDGMGLLVDHSILDFKAKGIELFAQCAPLGSSADKPVEPLYLRRPDVSTPNPLKHVLRDNHTTSKGSYAGVPSLDDGNQ